jgi:hypothetical protein
MNEKSSKCKIVKLQKKRINKPKILQKSTNCTAIVNSAKKPNHSEKTSNNIKDLLSQRKDTGNLNSKATQLQSNNSTNKSQEQITTIAEICSTLIAHLDASINGNALSKQIIEQQNLWSQDDTALEVLTKIVSIWQKIYSKIPEKTENISISTLTDADIEIISNFCKHYSLNNTAK